MNRIFAIVCTVILFTFQRCDEEVVLPLQDVQFSFSAADLTGGRTGEFQLPAGAHLLISVATRDGRSVFSFKEVKIYNFNGEYITQPLALHPGSYQITDFLVVDDASQVIFATPKQHSEMSRLVANSLPYTFQVARNKVSEVSMKVVDIRNQKPHVVGYVSFSFDLIFPWKLAVFIPKDGGRTLTSATVIIEDANGIIQQFNVGAKVNLLSFKGDPTREYTLRIIKEGYEIFRKTFIYNQLLEQLGNLPFEVVLLPEQEFTFVPQKDAQFTITLKDQGSFTVDWGDGNLETVRFQSEEGNPSFYFFNHTYLTEPTTVKISGDVDQITEFVAVTGVNAIDVTDLISLESIALENSDLATLDLSRNYLLASINFVNTHLQEIDLPYKHRISMVQIESTDLDWSAAHLLEEIIDNVARNAIRHNILDGAIILFNAGTVTPLTNSNIQKLRSAYRWYVVIE